MKPRTHVATPIAHLAGPGKLKVVDGQLAYSTGKESPFRLEAKSLRRVCCYGPVGLTDEAIVLLFEHDIEVSFLSESGGSIRGRMVHEQSSATPDRLRLFRLQDRMDARVAISAGLISAKIASQAQAARHYQRHGVSSAAQTLVRLREASERLESATTTGAIRGHEGTASSAWFALFSQLLRPPFSFPGRVRRPPTDPVNALLSLGYTLAMARAGARGSAEGLDIQLGALHDYRPGRPSLACDLVEPLRVPAVDRWVVELCNGGRVRPEDFVTDAKTGTRLKPEAFPVILEDWETHWQRCDGHGILDRTVMDFVRSLRDLIPTPLRVGEADI